MTVALAEAPDAASLGEFYSRYFRYYNTLDDSSKKRFIERTYRFINEKAIVGARNFSADSHVKALVAASAVQLTLGLDRWDLDYFDVIEIHPANFENRESGLLYKGETNTAGFIRLSWKSFLHGYEIRDDNVNLGLHEFSHALQLNGFRGNRQDYFVEHYFNAWMAAATEAFRDLKKNKDSIFRKYGGTNMNEFVCVCIEHYFESPETILQAHPLLYYSTAILLNQATQGNRTRLNVRIEMFEIKNKNLPGIQGTHSLQTGWKVPIFYSLLVTLAVCVFTLLATGLSTGVSNLLLALCAVLYVIFDLTYTRVLLSSGEVQIKKGLFLFRFRPVRKLLLAHLVSVSDSVNPGHDEGTDLVYYYPGDNYFHVERLANGFTTQLVDELWRNKIACLK